MTNGEFEPRGCPTPGACSAAAEIARLRAVLGDASVKLKLLYMAAGLGQKTGHEALAALNDEITKIDAALAAKDTRPLPDACAECGFPQKEHSYNGACYGLCGKFVAAKDTTP